MDAQLPPPSDDAQAASLALSALIAREIEGAGGWIAFARYMELALYAPGLGYYSGGSRKFGQEGDFLTAPEITPLFGRALARQVAQVTAASSPAVLEVGAGSGRLAADLLKALADLGHPPEKYFILELSGELRARQRETIAAEAPDEARRVEWLDRLPEKFSGCVVANELLDALPAEVVAWREAGLMERGVSRTAEGFAWAERPAPQGLAAAMGKLSVALPFETELGLAARAWTAEWGRRLEKGVLLLIDYGLTGREFYHPQRNGGTLRCHYRHRVHQDPFWWPGLSDITTHVDFTAIAEAGHDAGLDVLGYTSQAGFLMNCGLAELLAERQAAGGEQAARAMGAVGLLISPNEMGELFKVIALGRGVDEPLLGFARGDRVHAL